MSSLKKPLIKVTKQVLPDGADVLAPHKKAAMALHLALNGKFFRKLPNDSKIWDVYVAYFQWDNMGQWAVSILLFLSLFESPLWCNEVAFWSHQPSTERCAVEGKAVANQTDPRWGDDPLLMSGMPLIPIGYGMILECILFLVISKRLQVMYKLNDHWKAENLKALFSENVGRQSLVTGVGLADLVFYLATGGSSSFRIAPIVRVAMASLMIVPVRKSMLIFFRILGSLKQMTMFVIGSVVIFAWATTMIFDDYTEQDVYGDNVNTDIDTFGHSIYTAFLTVTTANLPDALVFTYTYNRAFIWIWMPFIFLGACVFIQVILAVVYNEYSEALTAGLKDTFKGRKDAIRRANKYLKGSGEEVTKEAFTALIESLQPLMNPPVNLELVEIIFEGIDDNNSGTLSDDEFKDVCDVIQMEYKVTKRDSPFRKMMPNCVVGMMTNKTVSDPPGDFGYDQFYDKNDTYDEDGKLDKEGGTAPFSWLMDKVLQMNVAFMIVESIFDFTPGLVEPDAFQSIDLFFSFVYIIEVVAKLGIWSWGEYWCSFDNRFDFVSTFILASSGTAFITGHIDHDTLRYINLLRILRLIKMLSNMDDFKGVMLTIVKMLQTCKDVLIMNILVIYLFSAVGQQLYGGEFYSSNPKLTAAGGKDLDYFDSNFQVFNYNDMFMGFVTLFFWMLTGWFDQVAVVAMSLHNDNLGSWLVANAFNLGFYLCSVLLAYNVFAAFSIDVYCQLKDLTGDVDEDDTALTQNLSDINATLWAEGKQLHVTMSAELQKMRVYKAMLDVDDENPDGDEDKGGDDK